MQRHRQRTARPARRLRLTAGRLGAVAVLFVTGWIGTAFASKLYLTYQLNAEVHRLERDNQSLTDANRAYQQQLDGLSQPAGQEELLRNHGYSGPGETVYILVSPSPSPRR